MMMSMTSMLRPSCSSLSVTAPPPTRPIPGSYGLPLLGPLRDRLDYFWFQGQETFFRSRMEANKSTVFRTNIPPAFPFFGGVDPAVVAVLDCASFSALFDLALVDKRDVLVGSYMPSTRFTGDTRVVVYQDPSEPTHAPIKTFCLDLLKRGSKIWVSEFLTAFDAMLTAAEREVTSKGSSGIFVPLQQCIFSFLCRTLVGADPAAAPEIRDGGYAMLDKWLALQLLPITKVGVIPQPLEELLLHTFPFPFALVSGDYRKLYDFVAAEGGDAVRLAESEYGMSKDEAIHNILFVLGFNAFGGFSVFLPSLIARVGRDKTGLQDRLRAEVRGVMGASGGRSLGFDDVRAMELVSSVVYEVLRLDPPVPLQFARARRDFVLRSHESAYEVKKGELLCGYQKLVMRDAAVFTDRPEEFVEDRFVGENGRELLNYLYWSNGPETGTPTASNKQCAAKDHVVITACLLVAEILYRYDVFEVDEAALSITKLVARGE